MWFTSGLFCFFGFISVVFAAIFLVNQFDFKRLLAYSSIENLGLVVLAIGLGTKFALTAAFLHIIFHALAKTVLFFTTGNLFIKYHSHHIDKVRAVFNKLPLTGLAIILGVLAITGLPPFALFVSKFMILKELIFANIYLAVFILIAAVMIFGSFIHYFNKILFVEKEGVDCYIETPISLKALNFIAIAIPLSLLFYFGLFMPSALFQNIEKMVGVISLG